MVKQSSTGMYQESRYIVDNTFIGSPYPTIQSALNDANLASVSAVVIVRPGIYTENLTLYSGVDIKGSTGFGETTVLVINGTHVPPIAGSVTMENVTLESATNIFASAAPGAATLILKDCIIRVTNGYTFNLPNWTGTLIADNIAQVSTNNGEILNTAGANILYTNANFGYGTNTAQISGTCEFFNVITQCPVLFRDSAIAYINGGCWIQETITLHNAASLEISNSLFRTVADVAIHTTSTGLVTLSNTTIDSAAVNVITGTGTVQFSSVSYVTSTGIAGTIVKDFSTRLETGILKLDDATVGVLISTAGVVSGLVPITPAYGGSGLTSITDHSVMVGSGAGAVTPIAVGLTGQLLTGVTGADPVFAVTSYGDFSFINNIAATPLVLTVENNDTDPGSYAALKLSTEPAGGDAFVYFEIDSATQYYSLGIDNSVAGDPFILTNNVNPSTGNNLIAFTNVGVITLFNDLDVTEGGTGVSTLTSHGILMGNGAGDIQATAEPANGQLLIGKTGDFPQLAQIQPGMGIAVSNGAGAITISAWGGGVSWTVETVNLNFVVNKGIIANKVGLLTVTLPATASIGDILEITGINTAVGWRIAQNALQRIHIGATSSTIGIGGYIESTAIRDSVKLVCVVAGASTEWNSLSVQGNLTVA